MSDIIEAGNDTDTIEQTGDVTHVLQGENTAEMARLLGLAQQAVEDALGLPGLTLTDAIAALAVLTPAANKVPYYTGATTAALADYTAFARTLTAAADAAAARAALSVYSEAEVDAALVGLGGGNGGLPIGVIHDGVLFDTARGDSFLDFWDIPSDATLTASATEVAFNSTTLKALKMKLKDDAGGIYSGCFERNWKMETTWEYTASTYSAAGAEGVQAGFLTDTPNFHGIALPAHGGLAGSSLAQVWNVGSIVDNTFDTGYAYSAGQRVTMSIERTGVSLIATVTYPGPTTRTVTKTLHYTADSLELPRFFSTPIIEFMKANIKLVGAKVSVGIPGENWGAICGTSITQGRTATAYADGWAELIRAAHSARVMVCGAPSATSANWITNLPEVLALGPAWVVMEVLANDMGTGVSVATMQANLTTLAGMCETAGVPFAFINALPQNNANAPTMNSWLASSGWNVIDGYTALVGVGTAMNVAYQADATHPNTAGHDALRDVAEPAIDALGFFDLASSYLIDADPALTADSPKRLPTQSAVKAYVGANSGGVDYPLNPGGRLTLVTGLPVIRSDQTAKTSVYYTPYLGSRIPLYNGSAWAMTAFAELTMALDTSNQLAEKLYDLFVWNDGGTVKIGAGPAWAYASTVTMTIATPCVVSWTGHGLVEGDPIVFTTTGALPTGLTAGTTYYVGRSPGANSFNVSTSKANAAAGTFIATSGSQSGTHTCTNATRARGAGAGTTEIEMKDGIWTNKNSITLTNGAGAGTSGVAVNTATYVGTVYMTANGQTGMALAPASASGGPNAILGVFNAYNRRLTGSAALDSTASWTVNTGSTFRPTNNSVGNRISFVDGLGESTVRAFHKVSNTGNAGLTAIGFNMTNGNTGGHALTSAGGVQTPLSIEATVPPVMGLNYVQAVEWSSASVTFGGQGAQILTATLEI